MSRLQRIEEKAFSGATFDSILCHEWLDLLIEMDPEEECWLPREVQMLICDYVCILPVEFRDRNDLELAVKSIPIPVL